MEETKEEKKFCPHCKQFKPLTAFTKDKRSKDSLYYICKDCAKERQKEYLRNYYDKKVAAKKEAAALEAEKKTALSSYTPRQLMEELMARGYEGCLKKIVSIELINGKMVSNY